MEFSTPRDLIGEAVLRRPVGKWNVHKEQFEELLRLGRLRNVELQVMPLDRPEHAGLAGPFILLTPTRKPQVGYLEVQNISRLITDRPGGGPNPGRTIWMHPVSGAHSA
ncbi:DUF5753 domain-containing protein [Streptomyces sp. NBC_00846]|uniref:Scr1 family TA system antitoxin-like transcriptional regulator n=1 Tax=Streptomyces sp. NBC_00846 TaxID=2975849 RepID=UPI003865E87F|nr:DUF5753 domain-containing protein [Streptomyces sp. NBC_00846]